MRKFLPVLLLILLLPLNALARCNDSDRVKLNKLASNVSFSYNYTEKNDKITFDVTVTNLTKDLLLYEKNNDVQYNVNGEITIKGFTASSNASFYVFAKDDTCIASALTTNTINFPSYNPHYKDELCKQAPNYTYCKKWINNPQDYDTFKKNITKYIEDNKKKEVTVTVDEKKVKSLFDYIGEFYVKFYYIILPIIIIICFVSMYYLNKKNKLI